MYLQNVTRKKLTFLKKMLTSGRSLTKTARSGSASQSYGSCGSGFVQKFHGSATLSATAALFLTYVNPSWNGSVRDEFFSANFSHTIPVLRQNSMLFFAGYGHPYVIHAANLAQVATY
jgi:hypothetical protein